jgi:flagellar hook-associated protein 2
MGIQIDGIVSGLDTSAMIDALVDVAALPLGSLESKIEGFESNLQGVSGLITRLNDFSAVSEGLSTEADFTAYLATVSNESAMIVEANSGALSGTYNVTVDTLAIGDTYLANGFSDSDSLGVIAEGTITVEVAGTTTDVVVDSSNSSLEMVAAALNEVEGVFAYVMTFSDAAEPYGLVVQSENTGTENAITLDTSGLTGAGEAIALVNTQPAMDASLTINGIGISSSSNYLDEVLPGLSITITEASGVPFDLLVSVDTTATIDSITSIVDAYNEIVNFYNTQTVYDVDLGLEGDLVGESGARRVMDGLGSTVSSGYDLVGIYDSLAIIGITTNTSDGTLSIDTDKLTDALNTEFDDVMALFTSEDGPMAELRADIEGLYVDEDSGTLAVRQDSIEQSIEDYEDQVADFEVYLEGYEQYLRDRFSAMEVILGQLESAQSSLMALIGSLE